MTSDTSPPGPPLRISVVIPTRNRRRILARTLDALAAQIGVDGEFEVLVVDDGSSDGTAAVLEAESRRGRLRLRAIFQEHGGPARARNRALALAQAPRALLLGDDMAPTPDLIARHLDASGDGGVQGFIDWHPDIPRSAVMEFLAPAGPQFYFKGLRVDRPIPWTAVLGANFSAPTRWFREDPFDENFRDAAFEDTELAYRWALKGRESIFRPAAVCFHDHAYATIDPFLRRQRAAGRSVRLAVRKHPRMFARTVLQPAAVGVLFAARHAARTILQRPRQQDSWDLRTRYAFLRGFFEG
jgi:glycosyltransferase involved in cell wall biosynthesis